MGSLTVVQVSPQVMVALLGLGAGAIAIWFFVRYPRAAPESTMRLLVHLVLAGLLIQFVVPPLMRIADGSKLSRLAGIFGFGFPALVYCMLAVLWLLAWATHMLGRYR